MARLWIPPLVLANDMSGWKVIKKYNPETSNLRVIKNGTGRSAGLNDLHEAMLYDPSENPLLLTKPILSMFHCQFDLTFYPFDTQTCYIEVKLLLLLQ